MELKRGRSLAYGAIGILLGVALTLYTLYLAEKALADEKPPITVIDIECSIPVKYETHYVIYEPNGSGVFDMMYNRYWRDVMTEYDADAIPDAQKAVEVCWALFKGSVSEYYDAELYRPSSVLYDSEAELWIVNFTEFFDDDDIIHLTNKSVTIVIQKKDGKIVKIFGC